MKRRQEKENEELNAQAKEAKTAALKTSKQIAPNGAARPPSGKPRLASATGSVQMSSRKITTEQIVQNQPPKIMHQTYQY